MIVEQRIYELKPGSAHAFLKAYEAQGLELQRNALGNLLGYFISEVGDLNRVIQLWGFESFEDRLQRRAALSANPQWREFLSQLVDVVVAQRSELLVPTSFSPIK